MRAVALTPTHAALAIIAVAAVTALLLTRVDAPYGRHARSGWGPTLSPRLAWVLMEAPAALGFLAFFLQGPNARHAAPRALLALWLSHYAHRAFVYPLRLTGARAMPASVALMGASFNVGNAWMNARQVSTAGAYPDAWLGDPRFVTGALVFAAGWWMNRHADATLRALRRPGEGGYRIPHGGMYRWVSSPNYLGEIVMWWGWALATWSLAGVAFAVFTMANLAPRAAANHRWYRAQFEAYPAGRRALIPGVW